MQEHPAPMPPRGVRTPQIAGFFVLCTALIALRLALWPFNANLDLQSYFIATQSYMMDHGRWHAMRQPFSEYFPAYWDLVGLASYLDGLLTRASQIKLIPLIFDVLAAAAAYLTAGLLKKDRIRQAFAALVVLAGPTVLINGSLWGQCDILYTFFLLITVAAVLRKWGGVAMLAFGCALAFKLQSVFLLPFLAAMLWRRRIHVWQLVFLPVGWLLSLIPVAAVHGNVLAFVKLPLTQAGEYPYLAVNFANPWALIMLLPMKYHRGMHMALVASGLVGLILAGWGALRLRDTPGCFFGFAALNLLAMPYVMPRMHDRYFFPAEVFLSIAACADLRFAVPATLLVSSSLISYSDYFASNTRPELVCFAVLASTTALVLTVLGVRRASHFTEPVADALETPAIARA